MKSVAVGCCFASRTMQASRSANTGPTTRRFTANTWYGRLVDWAEVEERPARAPSLCLFCRKRRRRIPQHAFAPVIPSFYQVDNSWGKAYKGWPTSIELHMGYKRDELRRDRLDRGRQVISNTVRSSTRAPTRGGLGLSAPLNTLGSPAREDLRISSPVRMRSLRKLLKGLCCPNAPLRQHTPHAKHQGVWSFWRIRCAGDAAQHCKQAGIEEQYCGLV